MRFLVEAYVAAETGVVRKTLTVDADDVTFDHGVAVFTRKVTNEQKSEMLGVKPDRSIRTEFVRAFAPETWLQVQPEPEIARKT